MNYYKIILNPAANKGKAEKDIPRIMQLMHANDLKFEIVLSKQKGHASKLAQNAASEGFNVVIAAGGDGTCNEVINGIMLAKKHQKRELALGVLPIGRGNDFVFSIGGPFSLTKSVEMLKNDLRKKIDIGFASGDLLYKNEDNGLYFGNGLGIGFDAMANYFAMQQKISGFPGYFIGVIKTINAYFPAPVLTICYEEEELKQPALMVSIMNGKRLGGGFLMAPQGDLTDGELDLTIAGEISKTDMLPLIPRFLKGTQAGHPAVKITKTTRISIEALDKPFPAHADGEMICVKARTLNIELLPAQIELICT